MIIKGSVSGIAAIGANVFNLPRSGLVIVAFSSTNGLTVIPIDSARNALFPGLGGASGHFLKPVTFLSKGNQIQFTQSSSNSLVTFYYGEPDADTPSLDDYSGVYAGVNVPYGTATGLQTATPVTLNFPSGKMAAKAIILTYAQPASGDMEAVQAQFAISTGEILTFTTNNTALLSGPFSKKYGEYMPLGDLPLPDSLTVNLNVYFSTAPSAASNVGVTCIIYYGQPGPSKLWGPGQRTPSPVMNPFKS